MKRAEEESKPAAPKQAVVESFMTDVDPSLPEDITMSESAVTELVVAELQDVVRPGVAILRSATELGSRRSEKKRLASEPAPELSVATITVVLEDDASAAAVAAGVDFDRMSFPTTPFFDGIQVPLKLLLSPSFAGRGGEAVAGEQELCSLAKFIAIPPERGELC